MDAVSNLNSGYHIVHEILESFEAGKFSLDNKVSDKNSEMGSEIYYKSHKNDRVPPQVSKVREIYLKNEEYDSQTDKPKKAKYIVTQTENADGSKKATLYAVPTPKASNNNEP